MKVKLIDLMHAVDRSDKNSDEADIDELCQALNLNEYPGWNDDFNQRVKGHWLIKWLCTDTWVGYMVYYFDDEPVAVSTQTARKNGISYEFVSLEAATKLRAFILECLGESEFSPTILDPNEETDPYYTVSYSTQLLVDDGLYQGRVVKVVRKCYAWNDPDLGMDELMVCYPDDPKAAFKINVDDFKIPVHANIS